MTYKLFKIIPAIFLSAFVGCSDNGSSANDDSSSSAESSSAAESSSSYSNRLDVTYADTLSSDTLRLTSEDSAGALVSAKLFLGEFSKGTLIQISGKSSEHPDSIFVREEKGDALIPEIISVNNGDTTYDLQAAYGRLGDSSGFVTTKFITTAETGFYYLDIPQIGTDGDGKYTIQIVADIAKAYYAYAGDSSTFSIAPGDTVRGFFVLGNSAESAQASFTAKAGQSINIHATGHAISNFELSQDKSEIASGASFEKQILPQDSEAYEIAVAPNKIPDYTTGPYAYFEISTTSRDLEQGEYFANPDSIQKVGDTLTIVRPRNDAAKYYLRQDQYVWLADLGKGDSVNIHHQSEGYCAGSSCPATYAILDKAGDSVANVTSTRYLFVAPSDGPYYLHYERLNAYPTNDSLVLTLKTVIQRLHYVTNFTFYDEENDKAYSSKTVNGGDTIRFSDFAFRVTPADASDNVSWYVPCQDLPLLNTVYSDTTCAEQSLGSTYLPVSSAEDVIGKSFRLIAKSVADTTVKDTLTVTISP